MVRVAPNAAGNKKRIKTERKFYWNKLERETREGDKFVFSKERKKTEFSTTWRNWSNNIQWTRSVACVCAAAKRRGGSEIHTRKLDDECTQASPENVPSWHCWEIHEPLAIDGDSNEFSAYLPVNLGAACNFFPLNLIALAAAERADRVMLSRIFLFSSRICHICAAAHFLGEFKEFAPVPTSNSR